MTYISFTKFVEDELPRVTLVPGTDIDSTPLVVMVRLSGIYLTVSPELAKELHQQLGAALDGLATSENAEPEQVAA